MAQKTPSSVLVTGANRGLGLEMVRQLLALPEPPKLVFATCRDPSGPKAQELRDLAEQEPNVRVLRLDVTDLKSIQLAETLVRQELNGEGLSLLINNAGVLIPSSSINTETASGMEKAYQTNVVGTMLVSQAFHALLRKAASAHPQKELSWARAAIINIGSLAGSVSRPFAWEFAHILCYRCSKAALNMLTRCQALAYAKDGILCAGVYPGWVLTDMGLSRIHDSPRNRNETFAQLGEEPLTLTDSIQGVLKAIAQLTEKEAGFLVNKEGHILSW